MSILYSSFKHNFSMSVLFHFFLIAQDTMSSSSDGKKSTNEGEVEEPWFEARVPRYVSAGDTFHVTINGEHGNFSMRILCPTGAGGSSKIQFRRSDGSTRIYASDNDTSTSESNSSSNSEGEEAKKEPRSDGMSWYGVMVPGHVSTGGLFGVLLKD